MYFHSWCLFCDQGWIGFWRCGEDDTVVPICAECGVLWEDPRLIGVPGMMSPGGWHPATSLPGTRALIGDPPRRWATLEEVESKGWRQFVAGKDGVRWDAPAESPDASDIPVP